MRVLFFLTFLLTLSTFECQSSFTRVDEMEDIFHYFDDADAQTLVLFDIDMVLIQPGDPAFQMANMKRFSTIAKRVMKDIPAGKRMQFLSLMMISSTPVLLDEHTPVYLEQLIRRGITVMGLTANLTGEFGPIKNMEEWRIGVLNRFGIDFSKSAPYKSKISFNHLASYRGYYSTYLDGVLFVNGAVVSKGDALLAFLEMARFHPKKIIFIDDREENLKSVEEAIHGHDLSIDFIGLHFTGAQNYPSIPVSASDFESRWEELASQVKEM
ncbi:putative secreted protein [Candidatus Protochlamydia naegleriophila]|uniref:Putative secreted protein n=1 Tax=Candidatus Protochlamydia naegleriophila TaxID=389348 RepID=A0A0U5JG84_9BACT|nr:DUF2608 domain-containing protein [Candidatus Protochlamydia naegleriophila]CUI17407.1 putative secreted protein [Candidatus Protochlamydia naegleriophila]